MNLRYGALRDIIETAILGLIVFVIAQTAIQNFQVEGSSMFPTLRDSEFVLVNKVGYWEVDLGPLDFLVPGRSNGDFLFSGPDRGDVIVFKSPSGEGRDFVKRVIGLPGDSVEIRDGRVFVNDVELLEDYISAPPTSTVERRVIPPEHYYVLGDNRNGSSDSRAFGPVHQSLLVGEVIFRWLPLDKIGGGISDGLQRADGTRLE